MNESTSNFEYSLRDEPITKETMHTINDWVYMKSQLPWKCYDMTVYLIVSEKVPGSDERRFISCTPVNAHEYRKVHGSCEALSPLLKMEESKQILEQYINEAMIDNRYIAHRVGHESILSIQQPGVGGGIVTPPVLGESVKETMELVYRGSWFTDLWQFLYEEHHGEVLRVQIDPDNSEYTETFELSAGLGVSTNRTFKESVKGHVIQIEGTKLAELVRLCNALAKVGNGGHSFTYLLNKKKLDFDGDGPDYIFRCKLTTNI